MDGIDGQIDAADVGLALVFPAGLRADVAAFAAEWGAVEAAVASGWSGLEALRLATAALNGSVAVARSFGPAAAAAVVDDGTGEAAQDVVPHAIVAGEARGGQGVRGEAVRERSPSPGRAAEAASGSAALVAGGPAMAERGLASGGAVAGTTRAASARARVATGGALEPAAAGARAAGSGGQAVAVGSRAEMRAAAPVVIGSTPEAAGREAAVTATGGASAVEHRFRADVGTALRRRALTGGLGSIDGRGAPGEAAAGAPQARLEGGEGVDGGAGASRPARRDGAYSPDATARGDSAGGGPGGGGNVFLDGRWVGRWLSESMARDASRPGAGTTFFDPRQGPAWMPSGSL